MPQQSETYDSFLARLGIARDSDEEIALLEKVFDISFCDEDSHGDDCDCGCRAGNKPTETMDEEIEEISDAELLAAVKEYLAAHPHS